MKYYPAYICENGHPVETVSISCNDKHCSRCGAPVISACQNCHTMIRGHEYGACGYYRVPFYCCDCGKPFPWMEKAIQSTISLLAEDESITAEECNRLIEVLPDTIAETPATHLAAARIKKALKVVSKFTAESLCQFILEYGCELIQKKLGL